ncbi:SemiSWEET transporter [Candidatus Pacearchaeota archaeon]|nr:SemiSWEET transporter [Candidatus Pacearchaeota archaeon]
MELVTIVGFLAAVCTTISYIPQLIKVMHSKSTRDLSLTTFSLLFLGLSLWLAYGILLKNAPLIAANIITLFFISMILIHKIKYK